MEKGSKKTIDRWFPLDNETKKESISESTRKNFEEHYKNYLNELNGKS